MTAITWPAYRPGTCGELGPWGTRCTDDPGHDYAHYDASDDSSWTDYLMREWLEDHPQHAVSMKRHPQTTPTGDAPGSSVGVPLAPDVPGGITTPQEGHQ